ncbi:MAG: ferrous iron transport protein A [Deltaproteobacteria bacterium]|nr:ferrous iron transport protein A [Deltaproteobacteria bacterium]
MSKTRFLKRGDKVLTLFKAKPGLFRIIQIQGNRLSRRLEDLGILSGTVITKIKVKGDKDTAPAIRVVTKERKGVLGGGMSLKIWVDYQGSIITLTSLPPNATGVVKELSGGQFMVDAVGLLGIREGEEVTFLHRLPPMDYVVRVDGRRIRVGEGAAAKVWGTKEGRPVQLTALGAGRLLVVDKIAGGMTSVEHLEKLGIMPESKILVEGVEPRQNIGIGRTRLVLIQSPDGMELWLGEREASNITGVIVT